MNDLEKLKARKAAKRIADANGVLFTRKQFTTKFGNRAGHASHLTVRKSVMGCYVFEIESLVHGDVWLTTLSKEDMKQLMTFLRKSL